jgi:HlyD family secretion protein
MKKLALGALALVVAVLLAGLLVPRRPKQPRFRTEKVVRGELVSTVSATGTLAAVVTVQVGTQVSGTIKELLVDFNSTVKAGQVIARIDPALFEAKVKEASGNYQAAQANRDKARADLADSQKTLERSRQLFGEGIISRADLDTAETKFQVASAALAASESTVTQNLGQYEQAQTNLKYATITSPSNGIVISRNVDVGQTVAASFMTPTLFTIAQDLTKMEIQTSVDEADISKVEVGQPVTFTVDAYPSQTFQGSVAQIRKAPILTQNVVTYIVIVSVENKDLKLMPGMTADVTIEAVRLRDVLKVPSASLRFKPETEGADAGSRATEKVYALRAGAPVPIPVKTGITGDGYVEVVSSEGLQENDEVIIEQLVEKKSAPKAAGPGPGL